MALEGSDDPQDAFRILPLRVGEGEVPGILFNAIVPDIRTRTPEATADLIINRLRLACPPAKTEVAAAAVERHVFLAECTPDLEVETQPVSRQRMKGILEAAGWTVLPREEYPAAEYRSRLESDLRTSLAFVQLLGPYPWKRGGFDRIQNDAAQQAGIARFRFRSSELDLAKLEPLQREFVSANGVIATGFDDFVHHLMGELAALSVPLAKASSRANPPLIRIGIRSDNPDQRWAQIFEWMFAEQEEILFDQLGPGETFVTKHAGDPCQGFLIACDSAAFAEGQNSPRDMLEQCRRLQITEKDAARRPPVAIVYWPPPDAHESWSRLLRARPLNLHRLSAGEAPKAPKDLDAFFNEVRKVAL